MPEEAHPACLVAWPAWTGDNYAGLDDALKIPCQSREGGNDRLRIVSATSTIVGYDDHSPNWREEQNMEQTHTGGCARGVVRYRVAGRPNFIAVIHCKFCQRRLASAFAILAAFDEKYVEITQGKLTECEHRSDESGRWLKMSFCPKCGATVCHTAEVRPGVRSIAAGPFDETDWFAIDRHI